MKFLRSSCDLESESYSIDKKRWLVKLWVKELPQKAVDEIEKELSREFKVFTSLNATREGHKSTQVLILNGKGERIGVIGVKRECSLTKESYFPVYALLEAREESKKVAQLIKEKLKPYLLSEFSVNLSFYNPWSTNPEYSFSPGEFAKGIEPKLFYGVDADALARSYFSSNRSLLILFGKPGTGKSKLIQYLLSRAPLIYKRGVEVLVLKGRELSEAAADLHTFLSYDVVVLDDLETKSFKRGEDEDITSLISNLLSATDGFIPRKVKVIITTNRPFREIDPALLRPSRLFDIIELKEIDRKAFKELCSELPSLKGAEKVFNERERVPVARLIEEALKKEGEDYLKVKELSKRRESYCKSLGF